MLILSLVLSATAEVARAQLVSGEFLDELLADDFDGNSNQWEQNSTAAKLYLVNNGQYVVQRLVSDFDILPAPVPASTCFQVSVELAFDQNKNKEQSAGLAFLIDGATRSMYVLELNEKKQYRLCQRTDSGSVCLSGTWDKPWEKNNFLKAGHASNVVELRCDSQKCDVYFNGNYAFSFEDEVGHAGRMGLFIGGDSKAFFRHIYVSTRKPQKTDTPPKPAPVTSPPATEVKAPVTTSTPAVPAPLEVQLQELRREVEELRRQLQECCQKKR